MKNKIPSSSGVVIVLLALVVVVFVLFVVLVAMIGGREYESIIEKLLVELLASYDDNENRF